MSNWKRSAQRFVQTKHCQNMGKSEKIFQMGFTSTVGYEVAKPVTQVLFVKIFVSPMNKIAYKEGGHELGILVQASTLSI